MTPKPASESTAPANNGASPERPASPEPTVLGGRRVVVCRTIEQSAGLLGSISDLGGVGIALPLLAFAEPVDGGAALDRALGVIETFDWLLLTSANAVRAVAARCRELPASLRLGVVGPATAKAAAQAGWTPSFEPTVATAEVLVRELPIDQTTTPRVLAPLAELAADSIEQGLQERGAIVERVDAYRMDTPEHTAEQIEAALTADVILLSSPSTAERFAELADRHRVEQLPRQLPDAVVIGPSTRAAAETAGFAVLAMADPHTEAGLVAALVRSIES